MKLVGFLLSFIVVLIGLVGLIRSKDEIETLRHGEKVEVTVTYVPTCLFNINVYYHIKFEYKEKEYSKSVGTKLCGQLQVGDKLTLIYNEKKTIFLFENEKPIWQVISSILLFLLGLFGIYYTNKSS